LSTSNKWLRQWRIIPSRGLEVRLWGYLEIGEKLNDPNLPLSSWRVKGIIALGNSLGFPPQIEDLRLKWRILRDGAKNKSSGRKRCSEKWRPYDQIPF
jgi:hypothetical protein